MQSKLLSKLRLGEFCSVLVSFSRGGWEGEVRTSFLLGNRTWLFISAFILLLLLSSSKG